MLDYANAISGRICDGVMLGVECDPRKNGMSEFLYTRSGPVPVGQDVKTYDLCTVQLGVQGVSLSAGTLLGEVWVYYKVRLLKPKLYSPSGTIQMDIFLGGAASSNTLWMGAAPSRSTGNTLGCTLAKTGNSRLTLPDTFVGYVRIICYALTTTFAGSAAISFPSGSAILGYTDLIDASFSPGNPVANTFVTGANEVLLITDVYVPSVATSPGANAIDITLGTSFVATAGSAYLQVQALSSAPGPLAGAGNKLVLV